MLSKNERKIVQAFILHPRASDRVIAALAGVSQPTVSRTRNRLDNALVFFALPEPQAVGLNLAFVGYMNKSTDESMDEWKLRITKLQNDIRVIFAAKVSLNSWSIFVCSLHKDYTDYIDFTNEHQIFSHGSLLLTSDTVIVGGKRMRKHLAALIGGEL